MAGAQSEKPPKFAPIWQNRYLTGVWLQRSPIRDPGTRVESIYYGGRSEALIAGVNVELTNALTLARRAGCSAFTSQTVSEAVNSFYSFKSFTTITETIQVMMDGLSKIYTLSTGGVSPIYTKSMGAGQSSFLGINNTLYIGDGVDQRAWPGFAASFATITNTSLTSDVATYTAANNFVPGRFVTVTGSTNGSGIFNVTNAIITTASSTQFTVAITSPDIGSAADTGTAAQDTTRNWGIATGGVTTYSAYAGTGVSGTAGGMLTFQGPNPPTAAVDSGIAGPDGSETWNAPTNVEVLDGQYAQSDLFTFAGDPGPDGSNFLYATDYNFNIPVGATIAGVLVTPYLGNFAGSSGGTHGTVFTGSIQLLKAGIQSGTGHSGFSWPGNTIGAINFGSSSDLWGTTLSVSDVNDPNFGIAIAANMTGSGGKTIGREALASIDFIGLTVYYISPPIPAWTNPTNVQRAPNGMYATAVPSGSGQTTPLYATNYGLSVSGTIQGIQVNVTAHVSAATSGTIVYAQLLDNNSNPIGQQKSLLLQTTTDSLLTFGGPNDLWTIGTIPVAIPNSSNFGVQITVSGNGQTFSIDSAQIQVYAAGVSASVSGTSGSFSAVTGYKYVYEYANSNAVATVYSTATPPTTSTGPFTNKLNVGVGVVASTDPQVTSIYVFRTTDGGANYLALPTNPYPNVTTTITDNSPDSSLITTQLADVTGLNTVPPVGIAGMAFHMGRMWGFVNNVLYYAVGPDLGNVLGSPYEGWPPANFFTFPSKISKIVPTSVGLIVFTISDVYLVYGNASAAAAATGVAGLNVFYAAPFITEVGLLSQFAADVNGTTIYLNTADGQFLSIDPSSGVSEIGFPIGTPNVAYPTDPSLQSYNPANSYVTWHVAGSQDKAVYLSDGSTGWFRCNTSQPPEGGFVWSPKANIVGGCKAVQSIETTPGVRQLLIGPGTGGGSILVRNLNTFTDNGTPYPSSLIMGNIVLAYPGQIAEIDFITCDYTRVGTSPVVSVLLDEINGNFTNISGYVHSDPPSLYGTTLNPNTLFANRHDFEQTVAGGVPPPTYCRHLQIQVDFGSVDAVKNELLSSTIFGCFHSEK